MRMTPNDEAVFDSTRNARDFSRISTLQSFHPLRKALDDDAEVDDSLCIPVGTSGSLPEAAHSGGRCAVLVPLGIGEDLFWQGVSLVVVLKRLKEQCVHDLRGQGFDLSLKLFQGLLPPCFRSSSA
ncbi:Uu.00g058680.m01.CDS01 [Anthostomella pinea]|uniref:Uu.00g058680.m01.CDS01 n=1 Tax=Anthostomella pinea TaxID=933095 RepID=A0AAI8VRZ5_9PEZI|nr:Uu.00g058680.m01.CDS01 [Anthostomella pinea]